VRETWECFCLCSLIIIRQVRRVYAMRGEFRASPPWRSLLIFRKFKAIAKGRMKALLHCASLSQSSRIDRWIVLRYGMFVETFYRCCFNNRPPSSFLRFAMRDSLEICARKLSAFIGRGSRMRRQSFVAIPATVARLSFEDR